MTEEEEEEEKAEKQAKKIVTFFWIVFIVRELLKWIFHTPTTKDEK